MIRLSKISDEVDSMVAADHINLVIVEDNKLVRVAVSAVIRKVSDFKITGFAEDGESAIKTIIDARPDVALIDIGLPILDGIEVTRRVKKMLPELKVLIFTASDSDRDVVDALNAGADGYLLKEAFNDRLEMAVRAVRIGAVWLDPAIARLLLVLARTVANGDEKRGLGVKLSREDVSLLGAVAHSDCSDGACLVDPQFLKKLHNSLAQESRKY